MLKTNEYFYIQSYYCETVEDDFEKGEVGGNCAYWNGDDLPSRDMKFKSVKEALSQILKEQYFDEQFVKQNAEWSDFFSMSDNDERERGRFDCDVTVDVDNSAATDSQIEAWRNGKLKLYNCHIVARIGVRYERDISDEEYRELKLD